MTLTPDFFYKWANPGLFVYFRSFLVTISIKIEKSIDGVLGIRTRGHSMVGANETTELWRPPFTPDLVLIQIVIPILKWLSKHIINLINQVQIPLSQGIG